MKRCFHCNDPIPNNLDIRVEIGNEQQSVCCLGCKAAAEFVAGAGLGQFYEYREDAQQGSFKPRAGGFESFDSQEVLNQYSFAHSEQDREATIHVGNMYCSACVWLLNNVFAQAPGIADFTVNPTSHKLVVRWNQSLIPFSQILDRMNHLGFVPEPTVPGTTSKAQKDNYRSGIQRLVVAAVFGMQAMMFAIGLYAGDAFGMEAGTRHLLQYASLVVILPVLFFSAAPFYQGAIRGLRNLTPGMDVPVVLAISLAFLASVWVTLVGGDNVYFDSIAMFVLFLSLSRFLEMRARHVSDDKIQAMASLLPTTATRIAADGAMESVAVLKLKAADRVLIRPGDIVPGDGRVIVGELSLDESFMTGESQAVHRQPGGALLAGSQCLSGNAEVQLTQVGASTRLAEISRLLEKSLSHRTTIKGWADRLASVFVLVVLLAASLTALGWWLVDPNNVLEPLLSVLIVACPCALALATPTAITVATTALSKKGLLLTNSRLLETVRSQATLVFDKTGTLTRGQPSITKTQVLGAQGINEDQCLEIAASLESCSEHVLAAAFADVTQRVVAPESATAHVGAGIEGVIDGQTYRIGTKAFVETLSGVSSGVSNDAVGAETKVYLGNQTGLLARFDLRDELRLEVKQTIQTLKAVGFEIVIASGDQPSVVKSIADQLGIKHWHATQTPADKVDLIKHLRDQGKTTIMIGDGVNDAPVLSAADASIALDAGTALARSSADAVVLSERIGVLKDLLAVSLKTQSIIKQNISWAIGYNVTGVTLAAFGLLTPWMAAIGMSASSLLVLLNALRVARETEARDQEDPSHSNLESLSGTVA